MHGHSGGGWVPQKSAYGLCFGVATWGFDSAVSIRLPGLSWTSIVRKLKSLLRSMVTFITAIRTSCETQSLRPWESSQFEFGQATSIRRPFRLLTWFGNDAASGEARDRNPLLKVPPPPRKLPESNSKTGARGTDAGANCAKCT